MSNETARNESSCLKKLSFGDKSLRVSRYPFRKGRYDFTHSQEKFAWCHTVKLHEDNQEISKLDILFISDDLFLVQGMLSSLDKTENIPYPYFSYFTELSTGKIWEARSSNPFKCFLGKDTSSLFFPNRKGIDFVEGPNKTGSRLLFLNGRPFGSILGLGLLSGEKLTHSFHLGLKEFYGEVKNGNIHTIWGAEYDGSARVILETYALEKRKILDAKIGPTRNSKFYFWESPHKAENTTTWDLFFPETKSSVFGVPWEPEEASIDDKSGGFRIHFSNGSFLEGVTQKGKTTFTFLRWKMSSDQEQLFDVHVLKDENDDVTGYEVVKYEHRKKLWKEHGKASYYLKKDCSLKDLVENMTNSDKKGIRLEGVGFPKLGFSKNIPVVQWGNRFSPKKFELSFPSNTVEEIITHDSGACIFIDSEIQTIFFPDGQHRFLSKSWKRPELWGEFFIWEQNKRKFIWDPITGFTCSLTNDNIDKTRAPRIKGSNFILPIRDDEFKEIRADLFSEFAGGFHPSPQNLNFTEIEVPWSELYWKFNFKFAEYRVLERLRAVAIREENNTWKIYKDSPKDPNPIHIPHGNVIFRDPYCVILDGPERVISIQDLRTRSNLKGTSLSKVFQVNPVDSDFIINGYTAFHVKNNYVTPIATFSHPQEIDFDEDGSLNVDFDNFSLKELKEVSDSNLRVKSPNGSCFLELKKGNLSWHEIKNREREFLSHNYPLQVCEWSPDGKYTSKRQSTGQNEILTVFQKEENGKFSKKLEITDIQLLTHIRWVGANSIAVGNDCFHLSSETQHYRCDSKNKPWRIRESFEDIVNGIEDTNSIFGTNWRLGYNGSERFKIFKSYEEIENLKFTLVWKNSEEAVIEDSQKNLWVLRSQNSEAILTLIDDFCVLEGGLVPIIENIQNTTTEDSQTNFLEKTTSKRNDIFSHFERSVLDGVKLSLATQTNQVISRVIQSGLKMPSNDLGDSLLQLIVPAAGLIVAETLDEGKIKDTVQHAAKIAIQGLTFQKVRDIITDMKPSLVNLEPIAQKVLKDNKDSLSIESIPIAEYSPSTL